MPGFKLDTTGMVARPGEPVAAPNDAASQCRLCGRDNAGHEGEPCAEECPSRAWMWDDLNAFTQGYIEALFADHSVSRYRSDEGRTYSHGAFDMLAPEALERIIADCEVLRRAQWGDKSALIGGWIWQERQIGHLNRFPPLTVQIDGDGKVYLHDR